MSAEAAGIEEVVTRVAELDELDIARARFPVGAHVSGQSTRAAVDTVLAAYLTEQRRNSATAEP